MGLFDISAATTTDAMGGQPTAGSEPWNQIERDYRIGSKDTGDRSYQMDWAKWHGIYSQVPFYKNTIDKLAMWTMGKGIKMDGLDPRTLQTIKGIKGIGKDSLNGILFNDIRTYKQAGDSYGEIMRNTAGRLVNLKPLNPGSIKIVANNKGFLKKYEQWRNQTGEGGPEGDMMADWDPNQIFHLSNQRIADEIHGIPISESLQSIIKKWENILDVMHVVYIRYVQPFLNIKVSTDDDTEIAEIKATIKEQKKNMADLITPDKVVEIIRTSIPQFSTLDPLPWIQMLQSHFIMSTGVPEIILAHSNETSEATAKIIYLAFQQTIEFEQLYIQEQVKNQLGLEIDLEFPASIDPSLLTDARKNTGDDVTKNNPANEKKGVNK